MRRFKKNDLQGKIIEEHKKIDGTGDFVTGRIAFSSTQGSQLALEWSHGASLRTTGICSQYWKSSTTEEVLTLTRRGPAPRSSDIPPAHVNLYKIFL